MHELGLCADIVAAVERRAGNRTVAAVTVRVGRLLHVHPAAFEQSFAVAAAGSVAEGARVNLVLLPVRSRCDACGQTTDSEELLGACPACGALAVTPFGGDELIVESIEYLPRGAAPAGTGP